MANFLSFLSGFGPGATSRYQKLSDEERETKKKNNELVAATLEKRMSDESLTPEEQTHLLEQVMSMRGVDPKTAKAAVQASGYFRNMLGEKERQAAEMQARGGPTAPASSGAIEIPESPFAPIPQRSSGEIQFEKDLPQIQKKASITAQAQREAARVANTGAIEDKIEIYNKYRGTEMEDEVGRMLGMMPKTAAGGGVPTYLPGTYNGATLKAMLTAQGREAEAAGITDTGHYRISTDPDKKTIRGFFQSEAETSRMGRPVAGSLVVSMFPKDLLGNPVDPNQPYIMVLDKTGGAPMGVVPETELGSTSFSQGFDIVTDAAGNIVRVPKTTTTTTQKILPGGGALGQVPSMPVGAPGQASSAAPGQAVPGQAQVPVAGGGSGTVIGAKPVEIPQGKMDSLKSLQDLRVQGAAVKSLLPKVQSYVGPLANRFFTKPLYEFGGGAGLPDDVITFMTTMKELIATKAFERGGKTLPQSEQRLYVSQLPNGNDTPRALMAKLNVILPLLEKDYNNQLKGLTGNERKQFLSDSGELGPVGDLPKPSPGMPAKKDAKGRPPLDSFEGKQ